MSDIGLVYEQKKLEFDTAQCHASLQYVCTSAIASIPVIVTTAALQDNAQKAVYFIENKLSLDLSDTARSVLETIVPFTPMALFAASIGIAAGYLHKKFKKQKSELAVV